MPAVGADARDVPTLRDLRRRCYLTDGHHLFEVILVDPVDTGPVVWLQDVRAPDFPPQEWAVADVLRRLRLVRPG